MPIGAGLGPLPLRFPHHRYDAGPDGRGQRRTGEAGTHFAAYPTSLGAAPKARA